MFFSLSDGCGNVFKDYDEYAELTQDQLCPVEKSLKKKAAEATENYNKETNREKVEKHKDTIRDEKKLKRENAIFWERANGYLNSTQFCDISMPCTFRGQFAIKKPSENKLEGNLYKEKSIDMKKIFLYILSICLC